MKFDLPPSLFFESPQPPALLRPHLITALDAELVGKITHLTKSRPGLWPVPAPFDEDDYFDNLRESAPLARWALPLNQGEVQAFAPLVAEAVFGVKLMFVDSAADEALLTQLAITTGRRLETGAYVTQGYEDLATLPALVDGIAWALIPIGPERSKALFVTSVANAGWVGQLREWCEREGRNVATVTREGDSVVILDQPAPAKARENAMAHRIDALLGDIECYFGRGEEPLPPLVQQRIEARRKLQQDIARTRQTPPAA